MEKVEVFILSGFLGSGKTTLLKNFLQDERGLDRKTAVIMNELGQVSIDSNAVEEDVTLKELLGGCICCSIQEKLEGQLQGLLMNEKPEVIYIETTGVAHPVEVLDSILSPLFADRLIIKGIITTVDGLRWMDRKLVSPQLQQLLLEQVRYADFILINKSDELTANEQSNIVFEIQSLNTTAPCFLTKHSKVSIERLRNLSVTNHSFEHSNKMKHLTLTSFVYQFHSSISHSQFEAFLKGLPESIYRIKGYLKFDQSQYPTLFQFSYGMPLYMQEYMNMPLNLVLIGENIDWNIIEGKLAALEK